VLVHKVEHSPLTQFVGPDIRLALLVYLHIGDVIVRYLHFRRVWRAPEGGAQKLFGERRLAKDAAQLLLLKHPELNIKLRDITEGDAGEDFGVQLNREAYALDSTTIDLCLSLFPWAQFKKRKGTINFILF